MAYTEVQLKARDAGIMSWHKKSDDVLLEELAKKWQTPVAEDENDEVEVIKEAPKAVIPEAPKAAPKKPEGKVTFYWKDNRNVEFSVVISAATPTSKLQLASFASKDSVIVLDPSITVEKQAIEKLRNSPQFKIEFDEVDSRRVTPDKKGAQLDELMELETHVLVQMVGGSIQDSRKTRGQLIQQIMAG